MFTVALCFSKTIEQKVYTVKTKENVENIVFLKLITKAKMAKL